MFKFWYDIFSEAFGKWKCWTNRITEVVDLWAKRSEAKKLKRIRTISTIVEALSLIVLAIFWTQRVNLAVHGVNPTLQWFIWFQLIPAILVSLPAYYGWYFSDLGLLRNHYEKYNSWW